MFLFRHRNDVTRKTLEHWNKVNRTTISNKWPIPFMEIEFQDLMKPVFITSHFKSNSCLFFDWKWLWYTSIAHWVYECALKIILMLTDIFNQSRPLLLVFFFHSVNRRSSFYSINVMLAKKEQPKWTGRTPTYIKH